MSNPENIPAVFQHGSAWVRADFHMHSLADKEFSYSGNAASFASDYVAALKAAGIRVAVITNHNKFDRDEFKTLAKAAKKEDSFFCPAWNCLSRTVPTAFICLLSSAMTGSPTKRIRTTSKPF